MRKGRVRAVLESMIWDTRNRREDYRIVFKDRGVPNDVSEVRGSEVIVRADRIVLGDGREIPHHRILEIWRGSELLYFKKGDIVT
ncbi:MAG: RNA repair domain-containing protein [Candidatus Korarchaeum sp.]|nr:RNA repair domain-containing protein [Candidatus Korarchaeum sp.]MDW8035880.1 RNA repair domain-containing protein [Candidatus Korarchaeum sp.]